MLVLARLLLRLRRAQLERKINHSRYDHLLSRELDRIIIALEALS